MTLKKARIVGSKVYGPDGICVGTTCNEEITKADISEIETAMREHGLGATVDALQKKDKARTVERTTELIDYLVEEQHEQRQTLDQMEADMTRAQWAEQQAKGAAVVDQGTYEEYLKARDKLQQFERIQLEKERVEKQSASSRIKMLALQRQVRDGGTLEEAELQVRLENPALVNLETMEAQK